MQVFENYSALNLLLVHVKSEATYLYFYKLICHTAVMFKQNSKGRVTRPRKKNSNNKRL